MTRLTLGLFALAMMTTLTTAEAKNVKVKINGMVCGFCTQKIEKSLNEEGSVEKVDVSLEKKLVSFSEKSGKAISDEKVKEIISNEGFDVVSITRE